MRVLFVTVLFLWSGVGFSQVDSLSMIKYSPGFRFKDGLYLTHTNLKTNNPIPIKRIISTYNKSGFDFLDKLLAEERVTYYDNFGIMQEVQVDDLWGFCRRGSVYINWGDDFNRIPVMGSACHFIATITVYEDRYYNPSYGYGYYGMPTASAQTAISQFIMDFNTGKVLEYTVENVQIILITDPDLYKEFAELSKKKQKQMKFLYLRKFNEKHPLYIPIN